MSRTHKRDVFFKRQEEKENSVGKTSYTIQKNVAKSSLTVQPAKGGVATVHTIIAHSQASIITAHISKTLNV
jgi:hypothetical protein